MRAALLHQLCHRLPRFRKVLKHDFHYPKFCTPGFGTNSSVEHKQNHMLSPSRGMAMPGRHIAKTTKHESLAASLWQKALRAAAEGVRGHFWFGVMFLNSVTTCCPYANKALAGESACSVAIKGNETVRTSDGVTM